MESLEHNCGNISPTFSTNMLIFSKDTFLVLIARVISTNTVSSQSLVFVMSHFTTLYFFEPLTADHKTQQMITGTNDEQQILRFFTRDCLITENE